MERERWVRLYRLACELSRSWAWGYRFSTACIVGVFLWAVIHDRPVSWACDTRHWPADLLRGRLPSQSTMSRRLRSESVQQLLNLLENRLKSATCQAEEETATKAIDAKPLPVGGNSKDPEARWGRAVGGLAKGYKLYAVWSHAAVPVAWELHPMNMSEKTVAHELIARLSGTGYLLGDAQYDSNKLYDWAFEHGHRLLAPRRKKGAFGRKYVSAHRRFAVAFLEEGGGATAFHAVRTDIERKFGNCTSFGGGLAPLPAWVRRSQRVRLWVQSKLIVNAARAQTRLAIA
jgi:Transposase DDE domain